MKTKIGHYDVVAELGRGGMGVVYKGYEPALARYVAIKELAPALAHDTLLVERFLREARSMAALNDPHIIQIYFIGQENDQPFFVMEFVEGESLSGLIKREGRLDVGDALKILQQAAQGLSVAHDRGVIHRDIKPANLMMSLRGQVKIADFGIALANQEFDSKLTGTGQLVGTPGYLSPEVCLGKPVDQRSDIFALGIVLFEMLTGRTPFSDESPLKLMLDVVQSEIPDVRELNKEVDPQVAAILARMLAKNPDDRYADAHALVADLGKHPLVAAGGPLKLKIAAPAGPAATLVALATPVTPMAARAPTPPPNVSAATTAIGSTKPGVTQPASAPPTAVVAAPAPSRWPLWAAIVLIAVAGGAFALRGTLFPAKDATATATASTAAAPSAAAANVNTNANANPAAPPANAGGGAAATPPVAEDASPVPPPTGPSVAAPPAAAPASEALAAAPSVAAAPVAAAPLRERLADKLEARREAAAEAGPIQSFAVEVTGDPAVTIPAQQLLEEKLSAAGYRLASSAARADMIARVRAEVIGSQDISFYGQNATLTSAYLGVRPFRRGGRPLGVGFRQRIEYTPLNADAKVQQLLEGRLDKLVEAAGSK